MAQFWSEFRSMSRSNELEPGPRSSWQNMALTLIYGFPLSGILHRVQAGTVLDGRGGFTGG
jgi:hypothetical protein